MRRLTALFVLSLVLLSTSAWFGCEAPRDSYRLSLVFTADCKGYLEDCG
jgi:hypothetical protein